MRLSTSTCIVFNRPSGRKISIEECIALCAKAGYKVLDINFHDCSMFYTPLWGDSWLDWMYGIKETADRYGIEFSQSHLHFYNYFDPNIENKNLYEEKIKRGIIGSGILGVKWAVTHAATDFWSSEPVKSSKKGNIEYFKSLIEFAGERNVGIAIENLWELNISPQRRYTSTAEEVVDLVDNLHYENIGICWDFEHADIMKQDQEASLQFIADRLKATHVSDNNGKNNDHLLPFAGKTDWVNIMKILKQINYQGDFTYEILHYVDNTPDPLVLPALKYSVQVGQYLLAL